MTVGEILKNYRLEHDFSIEQVCEETKISKSMLMSIEDDDFSHFPAKMYVEGFISNLCEIYGQDSTELIKDLRKQLEQNPDDAPQADTPDAILMTNESPVPDGAHKQQNSTDTKQGESSIGESDVILFLKSPKGQRLIIYSVLSFVVLFAFILILVFSAAKEKQVVDVNEGLIEATVYKMNGEKGTYDLREKDEINIFFNNEYHKLNLVAMDASLIHITLSGQAYTIDEENQIDIDLDGDQIADLETKLKKISGDIAITSLRLLNYSDKAIDFQKIWDTEDHILVGNEYTLFKNQDKQAIEVYVKATLLPSHLSYHLDGKRQNSEKLEPSASTIITADDHLEIVIGNYKTVVFIVNKIPINLTMDHGKYSVTKIIKWVTDPNNSTKFDLVIKDYNN